MEGKASVNIYWKVYNAFTGQILQEGETHNTVVDNGLEQLEKLSNGVSADFFDDIAIGTDNTAITNFDTALGAEFDKQQATATFTSNKAQWAYTFTFASGTSETIQEVGVFNGASVMMNRALTGGIAVDSTKTLAVTITLNVTRP
jgi:hypothetical protein